MVDHDRQVARKKLVLSRAWRALRTCFLLAGIFCGPDFGWWCSKAKKGRFLIFWAHNLGTRGDTGVPLLHFLIASLRAFQNTLHVWGSDHFENFDSVVGRALVFFQGWVQTKFQPFELARDNGSELQAHILGKCSPNWGNLSPQYQPLTPSRCLRATKCGHF